MKEFRKAVDRAQPRWAKVYMWVVGVPAWAYWAYRAVATNTFFTAAFIVFMSAVAVQTAVIFRAFWRNDV